MVTQIYAAPVDDTDTVDAYDVSDVVESVVQDDSQKKIPTKPPKVVEILESGSEHQTDGSYSFHYRGADGTFREETAIVKNPGSEDQHLEINGAYSFFDADGKEVVVHYRADNRGFVPVGSNIPDVISVAARENSQLPAVKKNKDDVVDENDISVPTPEEDN